MSTAHKKEVSKVQAKLGFSTVSKDSTEARELPPSVRSRASAVRYYRPDERSEAQTMSTSGWSMTRGDSKTKQQKLQLYPTTPRRSSRLIQSDGLVDHHDGDVQFSQRRSSPGPSGRLPLSSGRAQESSPGTVKDKIERLTSNPKRATDSSSLPPLTSSPSEATPSENEDEDPILPAIGSRRRPQILDDDDSDNENEEDEILSLPANGVDRKVRKSTADERMIIPIPSRTTRSSARKASHLNTNKQQRAYTDDIGSDSVLQSSSRKFRSANVVISDDSDDNDSDAIIPSSTRTIKRRLVIEENEDNDEVPGSSSPAKKRRLQHGKNPRRMTREEQDEEIFEDAADLQDTATYNDGLRSASMLNSKKAARQRQLAKLQKRRNKNANASNQAESSSPSPEPELPLPYNDGYLDEDCSQADSIINDDILSEDNASEMSEIRMNRCIHSIPSALYYIIQSILYDKFIPPNQQNPHLTSNAKPVSSAYYLAAHNLIDKHLESYRNQFISSVWRRPFIAALYARPTLTWPPNAITLFESCEACGRRDRPAASAIRFEGNCYDEETLAEHESASDSDASSDMEDQEDENGANHAELSGVWAKYAVKVRRSRIWHVGADCHDKAWRAHTAAHWKFGLARQMDKVLGMMGVEAAGQGSGRGSAGEAEESLLLQEDRFHATLLQMEEQGYLAALTREFLERFEMEGGDSDDE